MKAIQSKKFYCTLKISAPDTDYCMFNNQNYKKKSRIDTLFKKKEKKNPDGQKNIICSASLDIKEMPIKSLLQSPQD